MDQESVSEPAVASITTKKLNAEAPEFVPHSSSSAATSPPMMPRVFAAPPLTMQPPTYYGYESYFRQNTMPFYGYNVNQLSPVEVLADRSSSSVSTTSTKSSLSEAHERVLNQVEFYFSDINLATTDQLFRFMSKDPEGYVPLSVVASFKKIKAATNGSIQLATILRSSKKLLVSEDGKKVKRQHPLTEADMEDLQSRIVVAENLPEDHSHQKLVKIFSSVGSVKSIRTCPPQKSNGGASSASKAGKGDAHHFSSKFHTFVEYESAEVAEKAAVELTDEGNWRNGLKVRLLLNNAVKPTHTRARKVGHEGQLIAAKEESSVPETQQQKGNVSALPQSDSQCHERQSEVNGNTQKVRNYSGCGGKGKGKVKGHGQGRGRPLHPINGSISGSTRTDVSASVEKLIVTKTYAVPRMPDGTRGFSMGRGRPGAVTIT